MSIPLADTSDEGRVVQLGTLGIEVSDLPAWRDFSTAVLGLQDNGLSPKGNSLIRMDARHHRFIISEGGRDDLHFLGWDVKDAAALVALATRLRAAGFAVTEASKEQLAERMVEGMICFQDPDGIPTEVSYGALCDHTPFVSARGLDSFVADNLGFGHVVISVTDPFTYITYLTDVLGAKVSDYIRIPVGPFTFELTFLHVNARHHSIAVAPKLNFPGAPTKRMLHIMIEADSIDAVGHALDLFHARKMTVGTLGRHVNDRMLSFYGKTPSGFDIEYGFGGLLIENENQWTVQSWNAASHWGHEMPGQPPHL